MPVPESRVVCPSPGQRRVTVRARCALGLWSPRLQEAASRGSPVFPPTCVCSHLYPHPLSPSPVATRTYPRRSLGSVIGHDSPTGTEGDTAPEASRPQGSRDWRADDLVPEQVRSPAGKGPQRPRAPGVPGRTSGANLRAWARVRRAGTWRGPKEAQAHRLPAGTWGPFVFSKPAPPRPRPHT